MQSSFHGSSTPFSRWFGGERGGTGGRKVQFHPAGIATSTSLTASM